MTPLEQLQAYLARGRELREKATPGKWVISPRHGQLNVMDSDKNPNCVAACGGSTFLSGKGEIEANAHLISDSRTRIEIYEKQLAIMAEALKENCCCPGENDYSGNEILCDECETIARAAALLPEGEGK